MNQSLELDLRLALDRFELELNLVLGKPSTGIFGPSGSGKTSLLETIAGLRRGAQGTIRFGDELWLDSTHGEFLPPERRGIGWTAQDGLLFPHLNVRRNILAGAARSRRAGHDPEQRLLKVTQWLDLAPLMDRDVTTLSGGERQRVALGRALCSGPRLLLLDEPFAALDLGLRRALLPFLRRIREELTVPMLLISHDPVEVQALCDDLVVLRDGKVVAHGEPREVLTDRSVFPMAENAGFENLLPGTLLPKTRLLKTASPKTGLDLSDESRRVQLKPGLELVTEHHGGSGEVLVGLRANDILLATQKPQGLSARNVLPARVADIRRAEGLLSVELGDGLPTVLVQVTGLTPETLELTTGKQVFLVFKATACRVYGVAS